MFARQLVALRRLGVVHGETRDGRGMGLFLLNTEARRWPVKKGGRKLLAALCEIGGGADSMWTTNQAEVVAAVERLDLRSVVSRDGGEKLALLVGPLSWLNHSLRSGVVLTESRVHLLKHKLEGCGMLFEAAGYADRRELLIRYDSPGSATWAASVAQRPWYDDRNCHKRKR